ncbi:MAG: hypothetical protein ACR2K1_12250, partial [Saprospiraceae bacterium]
MMNKNKLFAAAGLAAPLVILLVIWTASCTCNFVDCASDDFLSVRFLSAQGSSELMNTGTLNYDSLTVRRIAANEASVWNHRLIDYPNTAFDLSIETGQDCTGYSFQFGQESPDTLFIFSVKTSDSRCCPGVYILD